MMTRSQLARKALTYCIPESPTPVLWQHNAAFHRSTLFAMTKSLFRERNTILPVTPQCI